MTSRVFEHARVPREHRAAGPPPSRSRRRTGFTVIELVLVLVIVALIAAIVYPRIIRRAGSGAAAGSAAGSAAGVAAAPQLRWTAPPETAAPGSSVPLAVRVENPDGTVRPGVLVEFQTEPTAAGAITPTATSDAAGVARAIWSAGPDSGRVVLTARVRGEPSAQAQTAVVVGRLAADSARP